MATDAQIAARVVERLTGVLPMWYGRPDVRVTREPYMRDGAVGMHVRLVVSWVDGSDVPQGKVMQAVRRSVAQVLELIRGQVCQVEVIGSKTYAEWYELGGFVTTEGELWPCE